MKRYDLHMHSHFSPDSRMRPENILKKSKDVGLNGIAITDHHTIAGGLVTKDLNKDKDFEVIVGEEITTYQGDVIALFIKENIKEKDLFKVIDHVRRQDGILIIPHPFRPLQRFKYPLDELAGKIDAIETLNSRTPDSSNNAAMKVAQRLPLASVGSSDAHILMDIGKAYTEFDGELRDAIKERRTKSGGSSNSSVAFLSHLAAIWSKGSGRVSPQKSRSQSS